ARLEARVRQLGERVVDAQAGGLRARGDVAHAFEEAAAAEVGSRPRRGTTLRRPGRLLQHVGELDLDLGVLREVEGAGAVDAAALLVELVAAAPQARREAQGGAHGAGGCVGPLPAPPRWRPRARVVPPRPRR